MSTTKEVILDDEGIPVDDGTDFMHACFEDEMLKCKSEVRELQAKRQEAKEKGDMARVNTIQKAISEKLSKIKILAIENKHVGQNCPLQ